MGTYRYYQSSEMQSHSLALGTEANHRICAFLGIPADSSIAEIEEAFVDTGWTFNFEGDAITSMEGNDDQEISDPEELEAIASIFKDGSWFIWEVEGEESKVLFENGQMVRADEIKRLFPAEVYRGDDLETEIIAVETHLEGLKKRRSDLAVR
ncbi:MAG: hypothetical protein JST84_05315 [Acidobacteria bacterium]|nr:hypothetical protein [Acidobacteriota bacterium]